MSYSDTWRALREQRAYEREVKAHGVEALIEPYVEPQIPEQRQPDDPRRSS